MVKAYIDEHGRHIPKMQQPECPNQGETYEMHSFCDLAAHFGDGAEPNPEELIAAAHANCFSVGLSGQFGEAKLMPEKIVTEANLTMEECDEGFAIAAIHLEIVAKIPGADAVAINTAVANAREEYPILWLLNMPLTVNARLES